MGRDGLSAPHGVDPLVGFALDAHAAGVDANRLGDCRAHRVDVILDLRPLEDHCDVDIADLELLRGHERHRAAKQIVARSGAAGPYRSPERLALLTLERESILLLLEREPFRRASIRSGGD